MNFFLIFAILQLIFKLNNAFLCNKNYGPGDHFGCVLVAGYSRPQYTKCVSSTYIENKSNHKHFCHDSNASYCMYPCMLEEYDKDYGKVNDHCFCDLKYRYQPEVTCYLSNKALSIKKSSLLFMLINYIYFKIAA